MTRHQKNLLAVKKYQASAKGRLSHRAAARRHAARHRDRKRARDAVTYALQAGRLVRQPCEVCGRWAEAHHQDYAQPLIVQWLCKVHHDEVHHG